MPENDFGQLLLFSSGLHTKAVELYVPPEPTGDTPELRLEELEARAGAIAVSPEDLLAT